VRERPRWAPSQIRRSGGPLRHHGDTSARSVSGISYGRVRRHRPVLPLVTAFADGDVDASTFQHKFLELWKEDRDSGIATGDTLDDLMTGVDSYDENPDVLMRIDADQLRGEARETLHRTTGL
jgi:hypothetical protein